MCENHARCASCNKLLFKYRSRKKSGGQVYIKCPRCKALNAVQLDTRTVVSAQERA